MSFVICIDFVYPLVLMLVYFFSGVLGPTGTYCWVMKNFNRYIFLFISAKVHEYFLELYNDNKNAYQSI